MTIPTDAIIINVLATKVCDWNARISLKPEVLELLIEKAGPTPETGFWFDGCRDLISDKEPWGWFIDFGQSFKKARTVGFWFSDPSMATYFKLLWCGS